MDSYEATRIVFSRVSKLDPENASKIMGLLLIQDHGEKEMIRLAFGPENLLHSVILKARKDLGLMPITSNSTSSHPASSVAAIPNPSWSNDETAMMMSPGFFHSNLSFLNETAPMDLLSSTSPTNGSDHPMFSSSYGGGGPLHRSDAACLYYARGYCKNGGGCRFLHGEDGVMEHHEAALMRTKSQRLAAALNSSKCMSFLLQQTDAQGLGFAMINGGGAGMVNPASRQIYLTFPADSTFREEDVSNYFSIYGPVQDVRIPYQLKRMFGFVTFVYPETVKLILAKGNPHFVCDARVLVKPYKEKGKVHDKKQQGERGDLSPCGTPTGLDGRDPYDLQLGARMFYNSQDMLWRRKLEEQAELQQALELQSQRLMGLQLLDVKKHHHRALSASSPIGSPIQSPSMFSHSFLHPSFHGQEENCASPVMQPSAVSADQQHKELAALATGKESVSNSEDSGSGKQSPHDDDDDICGLLGNMEHILPDSPFASPTKGARDYLSAFPALANETNDSSDASTANTNLATSSPEITSFKPFNCQLPRLSSGHGAIGMYAPGAAGPKCPVGTS